MSQHTFFDRQLADYPAFHQDRHNLLMHVFLVPMFQGGIVAAAAGAVLLEWPLVVLGLVAALGSIGIQGRGHAGELNQVSFHGPGDFLKRIFAEQFVTFPRFVLSGGWWRALQTTRAKST